MGDAGAEGQPSRRTALERKLVEALDSRRFGRRPPSERFKELLQRFAAEDTDAAPSDRRRSHVMGQSKAGDGASSTPGTPGTPSASRLSLGSLTSALSRGQGPGSPSTNVPAGARIAGDPTMYEGVDAVSPTELLLTLPPPILRLIVLAAPILRYLATFFLVVLWKHPKSPWASWLLVFLWWGATLGGEVALRYGGINFAVAGWLTYGWARNIRRRRKQKQAKKEGKYGGKMGKPTVGPMTATPTTLVNTLVEAQILADCLNDFAPHWAALSNTYNWTNRTVSREVIFFSISSLPFILTLNYFVELRYTFCAIGTIVLTWKAPWLIVLRGLLWRSKLIRGTLRLIVAIMLRVGSGFMKEWKRGSGKEVGLLDAIFVKRGEGVFEDETKSPEARRENFKVLMHPPAPRVSMLMAVRAGRRHEGEGFAFGWYGRRDRRDERRRHRVFVHGLREPAMVRSPQQHPHARD